DRGVAPLEPQEHACAGRSARRLSRAVGKQPDDEIAHGNVASPWCSGAACSYELLPRHNARTHASLQRAIGLGGRSSFMSSLRAGAPVVLAPWLAQADRCCDISTPIGCFLVHLGLRTH